MNHAANKIRDNHLQLKELYARFHEELEEKKQQHEILTAQYENERSNFQIKIAALGISSHSYDSFSSHNVLFLEVKQQEKLAKVQERMRKDQEKLQTLKTQAQKVPFLQLLLSPGTNILNHIT